MRRTVDVKISEFAIQALEGEGKAAEDVPARLVRSILYYLGEKESGRVEWAFPDFVRGKTPGKTVELKLSVNEKMWDSVEGEAGRQGVTAQQLVEHAALFVAADIDTGRITNCILDRSEIEEDKV